MCVVACFRFGTDSTSHNARLAQFGKGNRATGEGGKEGSFCCHHSLAPLRVRRSAKRCTNVGKCRDFIAFLSCSFGE